MLKSNAYGRMAHCCSALAKRSRSRSDLRNGCVLATCSACQVVGLFTLISFSILPNFGKVIKKMGTFSLLPNFDNYIRNHAKIW